MTVFVPSRSPRGRGLLWEEDESPKCTIRSGRAPYRTAAHVETKVPIPEYLHRPEEMAEDTYDYEQFCYC